MTFEVAPNRVRHPDIAVLLGPRPAIAGKRIQGPPDLAIEIVSESDSAEDLANRIDLFLEHGATAVWVVWPKRRLIDIYQLDAPHPPLRRGSNA